MPSIDHHLFQALATAADLSQLIEAARRHLPDVRWMALTPLRRDAAAGPRWVTDSTTDPVATDAGRLSHLLAWLRDQPPPWRWSVAPGQYIPPPLEPFVPRAAGEYCVIPLVCRSERVGLLEMMGSQAASWEGVEALGPVLALALDNILAHHRLGELESRRNQEVTYLRDERRAERDLRALTGDGAAMRAVRSAIQQVARTDSTVLILGETGTGKELVARAIHQLSPRRDRLLVAVNCAALAPTVIASELFGHEAGAFTGATRRRVGRFELADYGTLFLDEVAEIGPDTQVMLLRVLQERVIERVGGTQPIPLDVRLVAATHPGLARAVAGGRFRADLFYRLNVFPIHVPPLRDRRDDIPDLVRHFIHHFNRRMNKQVDHVDEPSLARLRAYDWPGNVRELENLVERAMIVTAGDTLAIDPHWLTALPSVTGPVDATPLREQEKRSIETALRRCRGKIYGPDGAAALLGLKPTTLYGKMRKHRIPRDPGDDVG